MLRPELQEHVLIGSRTVVKAPFKGVHEQACKLGDYENKVRLVIRPFVHTVCQKLNYDI